MRMGERQRDGGGSGKRQSTLPLASLCLPWNGKEGGAAGPGVSGDGQWGEGTEREGGGWWGSGGQDVILRIHIEPCQTEREEMKGRGVTFIPQPLR